MKKAWAYILPTLLCFVLGGLVGWWQNDAIREWYPHLVKPALTPPNAAFPIAWSIIYLCMGLSAGLVLTSVSPLRRRIMALWFAQLGFNVLWSILFFVCRSPLLGMIDIALLDILVAASIAQSGKIRAGAAFRTSAGYSSPPISTPAFSRPTARGFNLPHGHPPDAERGRITRSANPPDGLWEHSVSRFSGNRRDRRRSRSPSARSSRCPCRVRESAAAPHPVRTPA